MTDPSTPSSIYYNKDTSKHPLEEIDFGLMGIVTYRGCIISRTKLGYSIFSKRVKTPQQVDEIIDNGLDVIKKSLVV